MITVEGDPDHPINRGTLWPKGASLEQDILNSRRLTKPQVRRPGSDHWEDISWDQALDEIAHWIKKARVATFIEKDAQGQTVNRCESIGWVGGTQPRREPAADLPVHLRSKVVLLVDVLRRDLMTALRTGIVVCRFNSLELALAAVSLRNRGCERRAGNDWRLYYSCVHGHGNRARRCGRILCPSCGEREVDTLAVCSTDQFPLIRIETGDECRRYIKTVDLTQTGHAVPVVDEIATIPLNLWAAENGYTKIQTNVLGL